MYSFFRSFLKKKYSTSENSLFYGLGMFMFSASSIVLLISVTRILGAFLSGVFSIGWAVCQQMLTVGQFGSRNVQVSDLDENFKFTDFLLSKLITIPLMLMLSLMYSNFIKLNHQETIIALVLTLLMSSEVIADVFAGFFQKNEKLAFTGLSYFFRVLTYDILFVLILIVFKNITLSIVIASISSYLWLILIDFKIIIEYFNLDFKFRVNNIVSIYKVCFSIFIGLFLTNYIVNIPKNSIAIHLSTESQAVYNILAMPSFIISLLFQMIVVPYYTSIASIFRDNILKFIRTIMNITLAIFCLTILFVVAGIYIGLPLMTLIFNIDINHFDFVFGILIISGGLSSISIFYIYLLTLINKTKFITYIYCANALISTFLGDYLVKFYELKGAGLTYLFSTAFNSSILIIIVMHYVFVKYKKFK